MSWLRPSFASFLGFLGFLGVRAQSGFRRPIWASVTVVPLALRKGFALLCLLPLMSACASLPTVDPDGDAHRHESATMPINEWITDEVAPDKGDPSDWKRALVDKGDWVVELKLDSPKGTVKLSVYNLYGVLIAETLGSKGEEHVEASFSVPDSQDIFIRIDQKSGGQTIYSLQLAPLFTGELQPDL